MSKFYITTPIYYVNAKPHIGHAYTTLAADVLARFHAQIGDKSFFLTGTDEHGLNIARAAEKAGKPNQEFCNEISQKFKKTWQNLNIKYSDFIRTTSARHKKGAQAFLFKLKENNVLYEGEYKGLYCTGCESFITEKELNKDGKCPAHLRAPEKVKEKNSFFKLKKFLPKVKSAIEFDKLKIEPAHIKSEVLGLFKQGLDDFSVSREKVKWGISLPWDKSQTIYVWVEALTNYITARGYPNFSHNAWPADIHLMAKDIIKFHCVYWPAMLMAANLDLPNKIFAHGFFTINGQKMSKSIGNIIDPNELIDKFGVDGARYLILSQFPFGQDGDIQESKFIEKYNADLANGIGNLAARVSKMIENANLGATARAVSADDKFKKEFNNLMKSLKLYEALQLIFQKIKQLDVYINEKRVWEMKDENTQKKVFTKLVNDIIMIGERISPFLPETGGKILKIFRAEKIKKREALFPRK